MTEQKNWKTCQLRRFFLLRVQEKKILKWPVIKSDCNSMKDADMRRVSLPFKCPTNTPAAPRCYVQASKNKNTRGKNLVIGAGTDSATTINLEGWTESHFQGFFLRARCWNIKLSASTKPKLIRFQQWSRCGKREGRRNLVLGRIWTRAPNTDAAERCLSPATREVGF